MQRGKLIENGVKLRSHERKTVEFLLDLGYDVSLIPKSDISGVHTPDLFMNGEEWEMKAPKGKGKFLFQNTIQDCAAQAKNAIIDIRRLDLPREKVLREFKKEFDRSKKLKKMIIITKQHKKLDYSK